MRELTAPVIVTMNGQRVEIPQYLVLLKSLMADFPDASVAQKLATLKMCFGMVPNLTIDRSGSIPHQTLSDVVILLAEEAAREDELARQHGQRMGRPG